MWQWWMKRCSQSIFLLLFANTQTSKITKHTFSKLRNRKKYIHKTCTKNYMQRPTDIQTEKKAASLTVETNSQLLKPPHNTEMYCKGNQKKLAWIENGPLSSNLRSYCEEYDCDVLLGVWHSPAWASQSPVSPVWSWVVVHTRTTTKKINLKPFELM